MAHPHATDPRGRERADGPVSLMRSLVVLVLVLAALDSLFVRLETPYRPTEAGLFLQAILIWALFGLLALVPTRLTLAYLRRRRGPREAHRGTPAAVLLGWMAGPVLVHHLLDRYSGFAGALGALASPRPWLEVLAGVGLLVLVLVLLARGLRRVAPRRVAGTFVLLALATGFFLPWSPERVSRGASSATGPNVLLLVWDTCRSDRLESYGYDRPTSPALKTLSADAIVFEDSVSVSCFTFTSHLSLLTGVLPSTHGARLLSTRYDPRKSDSIAEAFRSAGYRTGGFVGTDVLAGRTGIRYGFERYDDQVDPPVTDTHAWSLVHDVQAVLARLFPPLRNNGRPHWIQDFQRPAEDVLASALAWIGNGDPRPWFCFVNLYDVHWPYLPDPSTHAELVRTYDGEMDGFLFRSNKWVKGRPIGDDDIRHVNDLYDAEVLELDRTVADFFGAIDLDRTAVLLTSDHGEAFGEGGLWKHEDITEPQVRVPLILRPPGGVEGGRRVSEPVSGVDVAPTLLALAGIETDSLHAGLDLLNAELEPERTILVEDRDHSDPTDVRIALYRGPWKLMRRGLGDEASFELYDLRTDAVGELDVSAEHPDVFAALKDLLVAYRAHVDEAEATVDEGAADNLDALQGLGYTDTR